MKTLIETKLTERGTYRVAISHRAEGAVAGGVVAAWLLKSGHFKMPASEKEASQIREFPDGQTAEKAARKAFSVLAYVA
jgi:hypothetical protein